MLMFMTIFCNKNMSIYLNRNVNMSEYKQKHTHVMDMYLNMYLDMYLDMYLHLYMNKNMFMYMHLYINMKTDKDTNTG